MPRNTIQSTKFCLSKGKVNPEKTQKPYVRRELNIGTNISCADCNNIDKEGLTKTRKPRHPNAHQNQPSREDEEETGKAKATVNTAVKKENSVLGGFHAARFPRNQLLGKPNITVDS